MIDEAYAEGYSKTITALVKLGSTKSAVGWMSAAKAAPMNPAELEEAIALGKYVFERNKNHIDPFNMFAAGYRNIRNLTSAQKENAKLFSHAQQTPGTTPDMLKSLLNGMQGQETDLYARMGQTAKPRLDFIHRKLPVIGALGAGGLGAYG